METDSEKNPKDSKQAVTHPCCELKGSELVVARIDAPVENKPRKSLSKSPIVLICPGLGRTGNCGEKKRITLDVAVR